MELDRIEAQAETTSYVAGARAGATAIAPLLLAVAPFSLALGVAANAAGLSPLTTVAMSAFVFAGAAQIAAISMVASGAGLMAIAITTILINLRHVIYGLSLDRVIPDEPTPPRPILAFFLIDEAYGIAMARTRERHRADAVFLGASLSLYITFVISTGIGVIFASRVPEIDRIGLDFIFPLAFVALLVPLLGTFRKVAVAATSCAVALVSIQFVDSGITILLATVCGAAAGIVWKERD